MSQVLHRAAQLSANITVLASVREFLVLAAAADALLASEHAPERKERKTNAVCASDPDSVLPRAALRDAVSVPPDTFLARANALQRAKLAAEDDVLESIAALDTVRASVIQKHAALLAQLEESLVRGVYGPFSGDGEIDDVVFGSEEGDAVLGPDLVRAVDVMAGDGYAARVVEEGALRGLSAIVRRAVLKEGCAGHRGIVSLASSGFTAGVNTGNLSAKSGGSASTCGLIFGGEVAQANRAVCETVFQKVRTSMSAVLKRLVSLVDALGGKGERMKEALKEVWRAMERLFVLFVQELLGCSVSFEMGNGREVGGGAKGGHNEGLSLLPSTAKKGVDGNVKESRKPVWELERIPNYYDSFAGLVDSTLSLSPCIYNLEVIYSPLQQFIVNSERMLQSLKEKEEESMVLRGNTLDVQSTEEELPLPTLLTKAVDIFVKAVRRDVKYYVDDAFGKRAGTLLQPSSLIHRNAHISTSPSYTLPPLSQTQVLIDIVASCLWLCVAVPCAARRLGEIINGEVIKPFSERAIYALNLAESWTDAGKLLANMNGAINSNGEQRSGDLVEVLEGAKPLKGLNGMKCSPRSKALRIIRKNPELTTSCLSHMWGRVARGSHQNQLRLLDESEWNAVVRVIANAKTVITELDYCVSKSEDWKPNGTASVSSEFSHDSNSSLRLRVALRGRGMTEALHAAVVEAIGKTKSGRRMLREEVVERGIVLLHAEIALRCFSEVVNALTEKEETSECKLEHSSEESDKEETGNTGQANGLSKPSSIFKASTLQLSDIERSSEDTALALNEFDEFGDRIACTSDTMTDIEIEEFGFPNSLFLDQAESQGACELRRHADNDSLLFSSKTHQTLTENDRRIIGQGRRFGSELRLKDEVVRWNLSGKEREFIFCRADGAVGIGIRVCGEVVGVGDKEVALGARLFVDAVATVAAQSIGWPVVECDYSVEEGSSESGAECRTLLYAAGLL